MPWDLENLNPATRFVWDENVITEKQEWVELRDTSQEDSDRIYKSIGATEKVEYKTDPKTRQMQRIRFFSPTDEQLKKFNEEYWDFSIAEWQLFTPDGKKIPCTRENKIKMMTQSPSFGTWVNKCLDDLKESIEQAKETEIKNS